MSPGVAETLLELSAAARAAGRELPRRAALRARLEFAVNAVLRLARAERLELPPVPPAARPNADQALQQLRAALDQCHAARVSWGDVVAIVNREDRF